MRIANDGSDVGEGVTAMASATASTSPMAAVVIVRAAVMGWVMPMATDR